MNAVPLPFGLLLGVLDIQVECVGEELSQILIEVTKIHMDSPVCGELQ
jgi:hypothetical protein